MRRLVSRPAASWAEVERVAGGGQRGAVARRVVGEGGDRAGGGDAAGTAAQRVVGVGQDAGR